MARKITDAHKLARILRDVLVDASNNGAPVAVSAMTEGNPQAAWFTVDGEAQSYTITVMMNNRASKGGAR